ncbi:winged helix-turn-helix transcriptional regulator [Bradyrhizobium pachyrhizi]|uniref:winged helix-turn-helix transcriptional regulator n=1 Tax=Bradyrhizobium pachyrhizi TaxID=280333 RepID=UPI001FCD4DC1|nr:helix-turn-helix domain-containing protein [Bradyrhizobium pachyrhizi]
MKASVCPLARSLDLVGDRWSLLIVGEALRGSRRFSEFERRLGLAKNILAERLRRLVAEGVMEAAPSSTGSSHRIYNLSEKGEALYLTLAALWQWSEAYCFSPDERSFTLVDRVDQDRLMPLKLVTTEGRVMGPYDCIGQMMPTHPRPDTNT